MNKRIVIVYFAIIIIINIIGLFILPDRLVMQINTSGEANWYLNKYVAIAFLAGLGFIGGWIALVGGEERKSKSYLTMIIIVVVHIILFAFNL